MSSPNFWVTPQNLPKNNKNKIKGADMGREINVQILVLFESLIVSLLSQKIEENTDLRKNNISSDKSV